MPINFDQLVLSYFDSLREQGFNSEITHHNLVVFTRGELRISIGQGRLSREISLSISRGDESFSMGELIRISDPGEGASYRDWAASTDSSLEHGLLRLAELFAKFGQPVLSGDKLIFSCLERQRREWAEDMELRSQSQRILDQAHSAFAAQEYKLAASLLMKIEPLLGNADKMRLRISEQRGDQ